MQVSSVHFWLRFFSCSLFLFMVVLLLLRVFPHLRASCCHDQCWPKKPSNTQLYHARGRLVQLCPYTCVVLPALAHTGKPEAGGRGGRGGRGPDPVLPFTWNFCFCFLGTQISCFSPSSFSWRQAAFVDSYCWAAVQQRDSLQGDAGNLPLCLHKVMGTFPHVTCLL